MKIKLQYYGMLTEATGCDQEEIELDDINSVVLLKQYLEEQYPLFATIPIVLFVENKKLLESEQIYDGMMIDCMPPFSGG